MYGLKYSLNNPACHHQKDMKGFRRLACSCGCSF